MDGAGERWQEAPERRSDGFASLEVNGSFRRATTDELDKTSGNQHHVTTAGLFVSKRCEAVASA